jgi:hypothetical protein
MAVALQRQSFALPSHGWTDLLEKLRIAMDSALKWRHFLLFRPQDVLSHQSCFIDFQLVFIVMIHENLRRQHGLKVGI